jgi:hypothetical protein
VLVAFWSNARRRRLAHFWIIFKPRFLISFDSRVFPRTWVYSLLTTSSIIKKFRNDGLYAWKGEKSSSINMQWSWGYANTSGLKQWWIIFYTTSNNDRMTPTIQRPPVGEIAKIVNGFRRNMHKHTKTSKIDDQNQP